MKTRKFCPHCGRPLLKSAPSKAKNRYKFQCFACNEDFFSIEVLTTRKIDKVRAIRRSEYEWMTEKARRIPKSFKKPYPGPKLTKNQKVNNHGRNRKKR